MGTKSRDTNFDFHKGVLIVANIRELNPGRIKRALISVSDKRGIVLFAKTLANLGVQILSTDGTATLLRDSVVVQEVSNLTGYPELFGGRVKTLHPMIAGGILYKRDDPLHVDQAGKNNILPIDMVVVNLYPFEQTIATEGTTFEEAIEKIDIGGPTLLRAAAKNYRDVVVICDSDDYEPIRKEMYDNDFGITLKTRRRLMEKVFDMTAPYDAAIRQYLRQAPSQ
jgi:phosphoribosylaminoimidazolecarboxamide formyltransferase/IMP cyclohydrolase